jgi:hypothetical protein
MPNRTGRSGSGRLSNHCCMFGAHSWMCPSGYCATRSLNLEPSKLVL